ncbi:general stress protein [Agromyces humatus]|uniref:General stress protein 17M-like domain-containing protein n=1 Tax=Agromyces humatus TaxID=279573 RepID=A0ABN2KRW9_9MICO|nr:general stress protein [Agromyces humatus]
MTNQSPFGGRMGRQYPTLPKGETVATFETYPEAQSAVDALAKAEFPVKELAIVGTDLTTVERITGKLTWGRAGGAGAISGAWFGTFLGLLFFIFSPTGTSVGILISAILLGAGFGMIFGLVSYSVNRRRRDFTSTMQVLATRYAIIAEPAHVTRARQVLGTTDAPAAPVPSPAAPVAPVPAAGSTDESTADAEAGSSDASTTEVDDEPRGLTYGEAQDAARRAARERRSAGD